MTIQRIETIKQSAIDNAAGLLARYGLVIVIAWFGLMKFTNYEAKGIEPLVSESPFMAAWRSARSVWDW